MSNERLIPARALLVGVSLAIAACSASSSPDADVGATDASIDTTASAVAASGPDAGAKPTDAAEEAPKGPVVTGSCSDTPPPGFVYPKMPAYAGTCPTLAQAPAENTITSSGNARQFLFVSPPDMKPDENLPLVFAWHWLKGTGQEFIDQADLVKAVGQQRFIVVAPESKGDILWDWPFAITDTAARMAEEVQFFQDILACVTREVPHVNTGCISSVGMSSGALFTSQLGPSQSDVIASMIVLSGGVGGGFVQNMPTPARALPAIVLWGGPSDQCAIIDFNVTSPNLEDALDTAGGYFVECEHNCGHAQPPFNTPPGLTEYAALWDFVEAHPMWTTPGESPYKTHGLPSTFPAWCSAKGRGTAVERTGICGAPACTGL